MLLLLLSVLQCPDPSVIDVLGVGFTFSSTHSEEDAI